MSATEFMSSSFLPSEIAQLTESTSIALAQTIEQFLITTPLIWIENCGHVPHLEQPLATAKHILEFEAEPLTPKLG